LRLRAFRAAFLAFPAFLAFLPAFLAAAGTTRPSVRRSHRFVEVCCPCMTKDFAMP
jgi:hypothetical protein